MASASELDHTEKAVPGPTLALMYPKEFPYNPFQALEAVAARHGLGVKTHLTDMQPQMGIRDWLLPALLVGVTSQVAGSFFGEMGKDLYYELKMEIIRLWEPIYGPEAPTLHVVTQDGVNSEVPISKFGITTDTACGLVILKLPNQCSKADFENSNTEFFDLIGGSCEFDKAGHALSNELDDSSNYMFGQLVLTYDPERNTLQIVKPNPTCE